MIRIFKNDHSAFRIPYIEFNSYDFIGYNSDNLAIIVKDKHFCGVLVDQNHIIIGYYIDETPILTQIIYKNEVFYSNNKELSLEFDKRKLTGLYNWGKFIYGKK